MLLMKIIQNNDMMSLNNIFFLIPINIIVKNMKKTWSHIDTSMFVAILIDCHKHRCMIKKMMIMMKRDYIGDKLVAVSLRTGAFNL